MAETYHRHPSGYVCGTASCTDITPVGVINIEGPEVERLTNLYCDHVSQGCLPSTAMRAALRAMLQPPRIPEPGTWGVVEAGSNHPGRTEWVRHPNGRWVNGEGITRAWASLTDPVRIRPGIGDPDA